MERPAPHRGTPTRIRRPRLVLPAPGDRATTGRPLFFRWRTQVLTKWPAPPRPYTFIAAPPGTNRPRRPGAGRAWRAHLRPGVADATERRLGAPAGPGLPGGAGHPGAQPGRRLARACSPGWLWSALIAIPRLYRRRPAPLALHHRPCAASRRAAEGMARGTCARRSPCGGATKWRTWPPPSTACPGKGALPAVPAGLPGRRLARAAHPLTSIQGFSQALLDGALTGDEAGSSEAGRIINEESQRMRLLVEDLLYLSRVRSRQVSGSQAPVDVGALLREAWRRLQLTAEQRNLDIRLTLPDLPPVLGTPTSSTVLRQPPGERRQVHPGAVSRSAPDAAARRWW